MSLAFIYLGMPQFHPWKGSFVRYSVLGWHFFFSFSTLTLSTHSFTAFEVSDQKSATNLEEHLHVTSCFSLVAFKILCLCLLIFWSCLSVGVWVTFTLKFVELVYLYSCLSSNLRRFHPSFLQVFFLLLSFYLFLLGLPKYVCWSTW